MILLVKCVDRVIAALEFEETDRVPVIDNALQIYPAVKTLINYHIFPEFIKKQLDDLYYGLISSIRQNFGIERRSTQKHWFLRLLGNNIDELLDRVITSPVSEDIDQQIKTLRLYYDSVVRLGVDIISFPIFPSINVKALLKRNHQNFLVTDDYGLFTIDTSGDLKGIGVVFEEDLEKQIKAYKKALKNIDVERLAELYRRMNKIYKNGKKLCLGIFLGGFFETWYSVFGYINNSMTNFFRQIFKEYKNGLKGPYIDLLRFKSEIYCEIVDRLAEVGGKVVFLGEDCAVDSGPMISSKIYSKYFAPLIKKVIGNCHKHNMKVIFHSDGRFDVDNYKLLDSIVSTGIDGLHPLQSNAVNPSNLRSRYSKLCLCGGIDCTHLLQEGSIREVYFSVAKMIKGVGKRGLMLGSDNSIHSGVKTENYLALTRATRYYGEF
ncbi:MAG: hypothetical protein GF329_08880 [Candidatus Lokiarchaeota archaeon]|nr:hypothetical protein [Candidatus Lokiarchaeota archaeon]